MNMFLYIERNVQRWQYIVQWKLAEHFREYREHHSCAWYIYTSLKSLIIHTHWAYCAWTVDFKEKLANSENMIQRHMNFSLSKMDVYSVKPSLRLVHVAWAPKDREMKRIILWSMWWAMPQFKKVSSRGMMNVFNVENLLLSSLDTSI